MGDSLRRIELDRAMRQWRWAYGASYLAALWAAVVGGAAALGMTESNLAAGGLALVLALVVAGIMGGLAWGLHRRLSIACMIILFIIAVLEAIGLSVGGEPSGDTFIAWFYALIMFRGVLSIRFLRRFRDEMRAEKAGGEGNVDLLAQDC